MFGLIHRDPTIGLTAFNELDNLFNDFFKSMSPLSQTNFSLPSVDVYSEDENNMVVETQAPGFDRKDIEISVNNGMLEIRGKKTEKEEQKDKKRNYMVHESSASFIRRIVLPEGADAEKISAELDKGILKVTVPVEKKEAKRIEIAAPKKNKAKLASITQTKS